MIQNALISLGQHRSIINQSINQSINPPFFPLSPPLPQLPRFRLLSLLAFFFLIQAFFFQIKIVVFVDGIAVSFIVRIVYYLKYSFIRTYSKEGGSTSSFGIAILAVFLFNRNVNSFVQDNYLLGLILVTNNNIVLARRGLKVAKSFINNNDDDLLYAYTSLS